MLNQNTDWNAVSEIAGLVANSCQGVATLAWCMVAIVGAMLVFSVVATWDVTRLVLAVLFVRDQESRNSKIELYSSFIKDNTIDKGNFIHSCIDKSINALKSIWTGIKAITFMSVWAVGVITLGLLAVTVLALPAVVAAWVWLAYKTGSLIGDGVLKLRSYMEARKEMKEAEEFVAEVEAELVEHNEVEPELACKRFHWVQRVVAWLLAAHREEMIQAMNDKSWVIDNYGTLNELNEELESTTEVIVEEENETQALMKEFWDAIIEAKVLSTFDNMKWQELQKQYAKLRTLVEEPLPANPKRAQVVQLFKEHYTAWRAAA